VHGVVFEQVCEGMVVGEIVDGHHFYIVVVDEVSEGEPTNAAETVDSNAFF
jgi:hypothetical protein